MKKINSKGFSTVEVLLVLLVVCLVGGVGWYVWQKNQNTGTSEATSNSPTNSKPVASRPATLPDEAHSNWKEYSKDNLSFYYDPSYQLSTYGEIDTNVSLKSASYQSTGVQKITVTTGYGFDIAEGSEPSPKSADDFYNEYKGAGVYKNVNKTTINGADAVQFSFEENSLTTLLWRNDGVIVNVLVRYSPSSETKALEDNAYLLSTIKL